MRWAGNVAGMETGGKHIVYFVGNPEEKRPLRGQSCRGLPNINIYFEGIGLVGMDWIGLAQVKVQWSALRYAEKEPGGCIKCGEVLKWLHSGLPV
jgi:hypothetical protein